MPWQEVKPMDQKLLFVADHLRAITSFSELCSRYGISRRTDYKWVARYESLEVEVAAENTKSFSSSIFFYSLIETKADSDTLLTSQPVYLRNLLM